MTYYHVYVSIQHCFLPLLFQKILQYVTYIHVRALIVLIFTFLSKVLHSYCNQNRLPMNINHNSIPLSHINTQIIPVLFLISKPYPDGHVGITFHLNDFPVHLYLPAPYINASPTLAPEVTLNMTRKPPSLCCQWQVYLVTIHCYLSPPNTTPIKCLHLTAA